MKYNSIIFANYPRGRDWTAPIANYCDQPFKTLNVDLNGDCYLCMCEAHLPISVGNILDFERLEDIWKNPIARELQSTILNKTFDYCAVQHCGIINQNIEMPTYHVGFNIDESCNLACPSCRRNSINHTSGAIYEQRLKQVNHFVGLINQFNEPIRITMSGNGDPLASGIMRPLLLNWMPKPNQSIKLHTNGLLMQKLLPQAPILPRITEFHISVDAGSKEIYEVVRTPGKFDVLIQNLTWLKHNRGTAKVTLLFVVSAVNVMDIVNFAKLCIDYGFSGEYTKLDNWGTFDDFSKYDVSQTIHPLHTEMQTQLAQVANLPNIVIQNILKNKQIH
jgi:MoaA/NifB/PqqE/SkfB family radical SAM enzyme